MGFTAPGSLLFYLVSQLFNKVLCLYGIGIAESFPEPEIDDRTRHGTSENHILLVNRDRFRGGQVTQSQSRSLRMEKSLG